MAIYHPPVRDMQFVLHELLHAEKVFSALPGFEEASRDMIDAVLEEGGKICEQMVFPTNQIGDEQGAQLRDGNVSTPVEFKQAYDALQQAGWFSLGCDPQYGGQGLPHTLSVFFDEMLQSANVAFALYPGLTRGAYMAMRAYASDALKQKYLPKMVSGEWTGAMCLTEPHCTPIWVCCVRAPNRSMTVAMP